MRATLLIEIHGEDLITPTLGRDRQIDPSYCPRRLLRRLQRGTTAKALRRRVGCAWQGLRSASRATGCKNGVIISLKRTPGPSEAPRRTAGGADGY